MECISQLIFRGFPDNMDYQNMTLFPSAADDLGILNHIIGICYDDMEFYHYAAENIETSNELRQLRIFFCIKKDAIRKLSDQVSYSDFPVIQHGTFQGRLRLSIHKFQQKCVNFDKRRCIGELERQEYRFLCLLKHSAKKVHRKNLSFQLATIAAYLQIAYDTMQQNIKLL